MTWRRLWPLFVFAATAHAQIGRRPQFNTDPPYWVGLSYGYMDGTTMTDGDTGATWQFGYSSQIRATIEKTLQQGVSAGISAGFSTAPLTYTNGSLNNPCGFSCTANADVTQWMAFIHGGSGYGFHGVYNLEAGFTQFSNFRAKDTDARLPSSGHYDFTFGLGGGLGYALSRTTDVYVSEMFDWVLHPQGDNVSQSAPRVLTFRVGGRVGF